MRKENVGWEALARAILSEREISAAEALRQAAKNTPPAEPAGKPGHKME